MACPGTWHVWGTLKQFGMSGVSSGGGEVWSEVEKEGRGKILEAFSFSVMGV